MNYHLTIIYDGIENSVFAGQVLTPLVQKLTQHPNDRGLIISFEKKKLSAAAIAAITNHKNIDCIILHKIPFFGTLSLRYAVYQLGRIIPHYPIISMTVRGPLAAWIFTHTKMATSVCTVQARGLAAQEYAYAHADAPSWFMKQFHQFRRRQYEAIERFVYGTAAHTSPLLIRAVSESLRSYIIDTFGTPPEKIIVEETDIPQKINPDVLQRWRATIRTTLAIDAMTYVYVYNGSAKAWQCPNETVAYFAEQYRKNQHTFLLILTQDQQPFINLCTQYAIPSGAYHITHVPHTQIYQYLAAADAGIIFRKSHIINWVSRPTKILEYQAVGLKMIHNNTVAMLVENH